MLSTIFASQKDLKEHLCSALLQGNAGEVIKLKKYVQNDQIVKIKDDLLHELNTRYLNKDLPFCQLTAAAQAASVLYDATLPPVVCCGAIQGNTSSTGRNYMLMLLRAWGIPGMDLGTDVRPEAILAAVERYRLRFVVCTVFSETNFEEVLKLHVLAVQRGLRNCFSLLTSGARIPGYYAERFPTDFSDHRAAAAAEWVETEWKKQQF